MEELLWKCNTPQLLNEILSNPHNGILSKPIKIFSLILQELAIRAAELNDDRLNAIMCKLALYSISDPYDKEFDKELANKIIKKGYPEISA